MLIEFSVENFKCFAEKQTLDMRPDPDITSLDENLIRTGLMDEAGEELVLLPSVAIYGANASGKSSLIEALASYYRQKEKGNIDLTLVWYPEKMQRFFGNENSIKFHSQILVLNKEHHSCYIPISGEIQRHIEYDVPCILTQTDDSSLPNIVGKPSMGGMGSPLKINDTKQFEQNFKQSFRLHLSNFNLENHEQIFFRPLFLLDEIIESSKADKRGWFWLKDANHHPLIKALLDPKQKIKLEKLLEKADFNISHIEVDSKNDGAETVYFLTFKIKGQEKLLPFRNQSQGTKQFLLIMPTIVHVLETGAVLLADELEAHLHPDLCRAIIELFNNPETNPKGSQLIFTTHNQDFMAPNLMRPDQIYFVNKDQSTGASEVYRASSKKTIDWERADTGLAYQLKLLKAKPSIESLSTTEEES
jgi:AAA15 family ATPase/GTPase